MKFYAINADSRSLQSANPANLNLLIQPLREGETLEELGELAVVQAGDALDLEDQIAREEVAIDGRPALRLGYRSTVTNPLGENFSLRTWQYLLIDRGNYVALTGSMAADLEAELGDEVAEVARSLRLFLPDS